MAKDPKKNRALAGELRKMLKPLDLEVIGHVESEALCCSNGTVAMVKIDKGDPAPRTAAKKR